MTRYAEAAAALGALAAPMLLANDSPDEQFSLKPGDTYYFDLSGANIPGSEIISASGPIVFNSSK